MAGPIATIKFKRLTESAILPTRATEGAACFDLYANELHIIDDMRTRRTVGTGIAIELPPGHVGLVCSRSGLAAKEGLFVVNAPGIIDEDYRGELKVILGRLAYTPQWPDPDIFSIEPGMRIAQLMIMPLPQLQVEEVGELSTTARGQGGLGSTGV
jgi:dUTP pyrophosphatase